ncbi:hypothetical protein GE061_000734 [Apolygus lucorum]|uniref:Uncharacterized protein n=1 Tax=Apolygus lucorum TaxID=248454 RepID=A0A6A4KLZ5_APOLU|nr:hypothetical protein GE061_000734 [Apolygus lucorum]
MYKKQVKQFQCLLCAAVLSLFAIALITAVVFSVDEDELDNMINGNASLEGKLQASPGGTGKPPKPVKLYTSGTVIKGFAKGGFEGEEMSQIFDGKLPVTIHLDSIIDPTAWSATADLTWSGVVMNNDTVKGTFSLPAKIMNGTEKVDKTFKGEFEITMAFKWSANLNIVIPNKVYNCKAVFIAAYKSSMDSDPGVVAQSTTKGKTDPTVETCNVLFQGSFYERSFFCYLTPWWCSDEKLFYWNGGLEFKITKPPPSEPPSTPNALKLGSSGLKALPEDGMSVFMGAKILGTVSSGWMTIIDDTGATKTIWNGEIPGTFALPMIQASKDVQGLMWSASVSSNSLRGTFKMMQKTSSGAPKLLEGSFFFMLQSEPTTSLTTILDSGVQYSSTLSFTEKMAVFNGTQIIDFVSHNSSASSDTTAVNTPVIVSGKYDYVSNTFIWDGKFQMIARKITKNSMSADNRPVLGSSAWDWKPFAGTPIGSKLISKVVSGWLTIQDESGTKTIWNGEFPADINAPMFFNPTTNVSDLSDEYGHGAVWSCSVFHSSLRGSFQLPQYTRFGLVKWLKGSFFFQVESNPSWSLYDAVFPGINYNSPIHFRNSDEPYNISQLIPFYSHGAEPGTEDMGYIAPIVLLGKGNKASKSFSWDGRFEMVIKKMYKNPNAILKSAADDTNGNDMPQPAVVPQPTVVPKPALENTLKAADGTPVGSKLIGKVSSGWVTIVDDSGTKTVWNGEIPTAINAPMFYNPTTNLSDLSDEYGHGAIWSCSVFHSSLRGTFQLPQYTKFGLVKWLKGSFFFQLESDPSWSLFDAIYPGINYNSPIHFRNSDQPYNGSKLIQFYSHGPWGAFEDLGYKAHIILLGKSEKLSKAFTWDGRFEMIIKKDFDSIDKTDKDNQLQIASKRPALNMTPKKALAGIEPTVVGSKLLGKVSSGWITVTSDSGTQTIWNGELPAKISAPLFYNATTDMSELTDEYGHGAVWSCSVFHSTLKGSFQLPQYTKFGLVKWVKGNFFFQLESSPEWSLYDSIVPGINYYSPIHFRTAGKEFNETKTINLYSYGQSPMDNLGFKAPILLLGQGQGKGKTRSFTWDGRFVVVVKKLY